MFGRQKANFTQGSVISLAKLIVFVKHLASCGCWDESGGEQTGG